MSYLILRYISEDVERQWKQHNVGENDQLAWESYRELVYGFLDEEDKDADQEVAEEHMSYK